MQPKKLNLRVGTSTPIGKWSPAYELGELLSDFTVEFVHIANYTPFVDSNQQWSGALSALSNGHIDTVEYSM